MFSGFSRRQILKLIGASVTGAAAAASIPLIGKFFVSKVQAQTADLAQTAVQQENYKNNTISVTSNTFKQSAVTAETAQVSANAYDLPYALSVNGHAVEVIRNKQSGKYRSYLLPFEEFDSPQALGKALIDTRALGAGKTNN